MQNPGDRRGERRVRRRGGQSANCGKSVENAKIAAFVINLQELHYIIHIHLIILLVIHPFLNHILITLLHYLLIIHLHLILILPNKAIVVQLHQQLIQAILEMLKTNKTTDFQVVVKD